MTLLNRKLLVLDLDETLVYANEQSLQRCADFRLGLHHVYRRPHLSRFLSFALTTFDVGIWSAAGDRYAQEMVERIFPKGAPLCFVWSGLQCTLSRDAQTGEFRTAKKLRRLKSKGYTLNSVIAVDDAPSVYARYFGNLVVVRKYLGAEDDRELLLLMQYLDHLSKFQNVRTVEKRYWRAEVHSGFRGTWVQG